MSWTNQKADPVEFVSPLPPPEKSNTLAWILSAMVHLLLIAALFFGVQWKSKAPSSVAVEVWRSAPAPTPAPVLKPEPAPEPPPPPKVEAKPAPKAEPVPVAKPDIAIKDEKKPKKEEPKKVEPPKEEPKKKPEPKKEEPKKPEPERRPSFEDELKRDLKQTQQQKAAQDQRARAEAELNQMGQLRAEQASASRNRGLADYSAKIGAKIRGNTVLPSAIQGNPESIVIITQLPTGEILPPIKFKKSSGNAALDAAIERAVLKSSPLPKPDDPALFQRVLELKYRPFDE